MSIQPPPTHNLSLFNSSEFVDSEINSLSLSDSRYLKLTGGTLSNTLKINTVSSKNTLHLIGYDTTAFTAATPSNEYQMTLSHNSASNGQLVGISFLDSNLVDLPAGASIIHDRTGSYSIGDLVFSTKQTTNCDERLRIKSTGLVGLGTTTPARQLEINQATGQCLRLSYNAPTGTATYYSDLIASPQGTLNLNPSSKCVSINYNANSANLGVNYDNAVKFGTDFHALQQWQGYDAFAELLTATNGSKVVLASLDGVASIGLSASGTGLPQFNLNPTGFCNIGNNYASAYPLSITITANVAVGDYGYLNNLGNIGTTGASTNAYSLFTSGRIVCTGELNVVSDRRMKENILDVDLDYAKKFIDDVKPVKFNYKTEPGSISYGYIAQDVYKAGFEDLVSIVVNDDLIEEIDDDTFINPKGFQYAVSSGEMIALLHKVIKNNSDEIKLLKKKLKGVFNSDRNLLASQGA